MIVVVNPDFPEPRKIRLAVDQLQAGKVIGYPTDTTYAIGCALSQRAAIERLYSIKSMKRSQPLSLICPDLSDVSRFAMVENQNYRLLRRLLPGAYTFILPATREVPKILVSKQKTIGLRVPNCPITLALVRELGEPLVTTTAGDHGGEALTDAREVDQRFGGLGLVIDGGWGATVPTTIVDLIEGKVLREGAGSIDALG